MDKFQNVAICGGGSWGSALACHVARIKTGVKLFLRDKTIIDEIINQHSNTKYLGNIALPSNIYPSDDLASIIDSEVIIISIPSLYFINVLNDLKDAGLKSSTVLLIATKGIIGSPAQLLSDKIASSLQNKFAFLGGPNFAKEVAQNLLTPVTISSKDIELANKLKASLEADTFVISITDDIVTTQIAGALKNVIAIKSGMYDALGYKENAKAGLITDGLREIMLLSQALGGKFNTMMEQAVLGDLILTCYSKTSRNTRFGYELTLQKNPSEFVQNYPTLVEGKESASLAMELAQKYDLNLPIISSVAAATKA
jgi:glycerol-3-phosphate dehydrogenase (NAD(P)+)